MRTQLGSGKRQGACDVVAIAYKYDLQTLQMAFSLPDGEVIGHRLAGMTVIGEPIDDGDAGVLAHLLNHFMGEGADHDALHHAFQVLRHVVHRLAFAQIDLGRREVD